jgi:hypothetical protein
VGLRRPGSVPGGRGRRRLRDRGEGVAHPQLRRAGHLLHDRARRVEPRGGRERRVPSTAEPRVGSHRGDRTGSAARAANRRRSRPRRERRTVRTPIGACRRRPRSTSP